MRVRGKVTWFSDSKGDGFISQNEGSVVFVHHSNISGEGLRTLEEDQQVEFARVAGTKSPQAQDVRLGHPELSGSGAGQAAATV